MCPAEFHEFDFSISFAGPERPIARQLAEKLAAKGLKVFYDASYRSRLLGKRLDKEFQWIFGKGTRFFVPIVSEGYAENAWPQLEWSIGRKEASERETDFILPLRLDDTLLIGLSENIGYLDLRKLTIGEVVDILHKKRRTEVGFKAAYLCEETWTATFGLLVEDVIESGLLPESAPRDYAKLCDWLENDLRQRLKSVSIGNPRFAEASQRDGETLSVRVAFEWVPHRDALGFGELSWWEVLEVVPYAQIYEEKP